MRLLEKIFYRHYVVDDRDEVRVIGPDGRICAEISDACSEIYRSRPDKDVAVGLITGFILFLNTIQSHLQKSKRPETADAKFLRSGRDCRACVDLFINLLGMKKAESRDGDGSYFVSPLPDMHALVSRAIRAIGMVTAYSAANGSYGGVDPSKISGGLGTQERCSSSAKGRREQANGRLNCELRRTASGNVGLHYQLDSGNRIRIRRNDTLAPRTNDPRVYERLVEGLEAVGAPIAIKLACALARFGGARFVSLHSLSIYDVMCAKGGGSKYPTHNKGDRPGIRSFHMIVPDALHEKVLEWIAGDRARLSGFSMATLDLMARNRDQHWLLKLMPVLTLDGMTPLNYATLYSYVRQAAVLKGLRIEPEYGAPDDDAYVSFHMLRHEYVFERLERVFGRLDESLTYEVAMERAEAALMRNVVTIDAKRLEAKELAAIQTYMCWSSDRMLNWYSAHFALLNAENSARAFSRMVDANLQSKGVDTRQRVSAPAKPTRNEGRLA